MDTNIYYNPKEDGFWVTSNFPEMQKKMDLGLYPRIDFIPVSVDDLGRFKFNKVGFDKIDDLYFQSIVHAFQKYQFQSIAFHESNVDLTNVIFNVKHLIIGDKAKVDLSEKNFKNLEEITFLSVKTFKGKILDKFLSVQKLILWYENRKSNEFLFFFPKLVDFQIWNGSLVELDITKNPLIEKLELHLCTKLEKIVLNDKSHLKEALIIKCKKLDISNLKGNVRQF